MRPAKIMRRPRSTMDSTRVSEAPNPGSIPGEATKQKTFIENVFCSLWVNIIENQFTPTAS
jgi:hypothetical protein